MTRIDMRNADWQVEAASSVQNISRVMSSGWLDRTASVVKNVSCQCTRPGRSIDLCTKCLTPYAVSLICSNSVLRRRSCTMTHLNSCMTRSSKHARPVGQLEVSHAGQCQYVTVAACSKQPHWLKKTHAAAQVRPVTVADSDCPPN